MNGFNESRDLWAPKGDIKALELEFKTLGLLDLETDPDSLVMSREGARAEALQIARALNENLSAEKKAPKLGAVVDEIKNMATAARTLAASMKAARDSTWFLLRKLGGAPGTGTIEEELWELSGAWSLPLGPPVQSGLPPTGLHHEVAALADWLELMLNRANAFGTAGGGSAVTRLIASPNLDHVHRCRVLLMACGKKHGAGKTGPLASLAAALKTYASGDETSPEILQREVRKECSDKRDSEVSLCKAMALVCRDAIRRRGENSPLALAAQAEWESRRVTCLELFSEDREQDRPKKA